MSDVEKTAFQEWVQRRAEAVRAKYSAYDCLIENGHGESLADEDTPVQVFCPFHPNTRTPAARYYPASGGRSGYIRCFRCKENWDSINMFAKFKGQRFMDALVALERRFHIQVPRRPEPPPIADPIQRTSGYISDKWSDIPVVLKLLEGKLARISNKCALGDYVKFCRVIDYVSFDYNIVKQATPEMINIITRTIRLMDEILDLPDFSVNETDPTN
jgi:hypothetical protein